MVDYRFKIESDFVFKLWYFVVSFLIFLSVALSFKPKIIVISSILFFFLNMPFNLYFILSENYLFIDLWKIKIFKLSYKQIKNIKKGSFKNIFLLERGLRFTLSKKNLIIFYNNTKRFDKICISPEDIEVFEKLLINKVGKI